MGNYSKHKDPKKRQYTILYDVLAHSVRAIGGPEQYASAVYKYFAVHNYQPDKIVQLTHRERGLLEADKPWQELREFTVHEPRLVRWIAERREEMLMKGRQFGLSSTRLPEEGYAEITGFTDAADQAAFYEGLGQVWTTRQFKIAYSTEGRALAECTVHWAEHHTLSADGVFIVRIQAAPKAETKHIMGLVRDMLMRQPSGLYVPKMVVLGNAEPT